MWKYLLFCFAMLVWAFFELSGGQDFESAMATSVSEDSTPTDDAEPIDRSFDREVVARAATNALRSIEFDDYAEESSTRQCCNRCGVVESQRRHRNKRDYRKYFG